jgi:flagellar motor switch protein FliN
MCNVSDDPPFTGDDAFDTKAGIVNTDTQGDEGQREHEASRLFSTIPPEISGSVRPEVREKVNDIPVEIEAVIGRAKISVAELMRVDPGHRFRLDKRFGEPIELLVNGRLIGHGEIVADHDDKVIGVRIIGLAG